MCDYSKMYNSNQYNQYNSNQSYQCNRVKSVELYRDGVDCPWGFRLKGGIDVDGGTPLEIIRVRHIFD